MGLPNILVFSALTGISFSSAIGASGGLGGIGSSFGTFDFFSRYLDPTFQTLLVVISSIFTIFFIFRLAKFFREIFENQLAGIGTAILGFVGSFLVILSPQDNTHVFVVGIGLWIFGTFIVIAYRKK
jgi:predicted tellurium resistance membrane protein TerC